MDTTIQNHSPLRLESVRATSELGIKQIDERKMKNACPVEHQFQNTWQDTLNYRTAKN